MVSPNRPISNSPMTRVPPPGNGRTPAQLPAGENSDQLVEMLRQRVNDLETRLSALEEIISKDGQNVVINSPQKVLIQARDNVEVSAGNRIKTACLVQEFSSPTATFSGILRCDTVIATTVAGTNYTPGAGNVM